MKFLAAICFLFSFSVLAQESSSKEELVDHLLKQNADLLSAIEKNNAIIAESLGTEAKVEAIVSDTGLKGRDNFIVGLNYGMINVDGYRDTVDNTHVGLTFGAKAWDDIWLEGSFSRGNVTGYPSSDIDTDLKNYIVRIKYDFYFSAYGMHLQPYAGYQSIVADSPEAGYDPFGTMSQQEVDEELNKVDELNRRAAIFGVSLIMDLGEMAYVRGDLGTDWIGGCVGARF